MVNTLTIADIVLANNPKFHPTIEESEVAIRLGRGDVKSDRPRRGDTSNTNHDETEVRTRKPD